MYSGVPGQLRQPDRAMGRLAFQDRRTRGRVVLGRAQALLDRFLNQHLDDLAVLGVDAGHRAVGAGDAHGLEQCTVVHHQHAGIGHEQLEAGHALRVDQRLHVGQALLVHVEHDHVRADVHAGALAALVPVLQPLQRTLPGGLVAEVDERGGAAERGRLGAGAEGVHRVCVGPNSQSRWVCTSTPPGSTSRPLASCTSTSRPPRGSCRWSRCARRSTRMSAV